MEHTTIAVDVAKSVFEVAVSDQPGRLAERHRLSRPAFLRFFVDRPPATVVLEACGSAHHWGRELQRLGHTVALLPASDVARYRGPRGAPGRRGVPSPGRSADVGCGCGRAQGAQRGRRRPGPQAGPRLLAGMA